MDVKQFGVIVCGMLCVVIGIAYARHMENGWLLTRKAVTEKLKRRGTLEKYQNGMAAIHFIIGMCFLTMALSWSEWKSSLKETAAALVFWWFVAILIWNKKCSGHFFPGIRREKK